MAGFGGSVKLTGESEYKKALTEIQQNLKLVSAEMRATSTSFENGDKTTQELADASKELSETLGTQKQAIEALKNQLSTMQGEYNKTVTSHQSLMDEYEEEKTKLNDIEKTLGTSSDEYKNQQKVVADLGQEVDKSSKTMDSQEKTMKNLEIQTANAETTYNQTSKAVKEMGDKSKDTSDAIDDMTKSTNSSTDGFTVMKGVLANLATDVLESVIGGVKQLGSAFVEVGKQSLDAYGDFEQLEGGVKKIFGDDAAQEVMKNANRAYTTAGMSANDYMETVTGFSASLLQGLAGDTQKAVEYADMAIQDMSDNANTFGTDMSSIQNAYMGFAKGNFSMLDNLKLGYGGTQKEMFRLMSDAQELDSTFDAIFSLDGKGHLEADFHDMLKAINIVQKNMNITGTTAKEAATTIQGSTNSMKAAWANMVTGIANENANFEELTNNFMSTLITEDGKGGVLGTIVPRISIIVGGIAKALQTLLPQLVQTVLPIIADNLPVIVTAISNTLNAIVGLLPTILPMISAMIPQIINTLVGLVPTLADAGVKLIMGLANGMSEAMPDLISMIPSLIMDLVGILTSNLRPLVSAGMDILWSLWAGLSEALPELASKIPEIIDTIVSALLDNLVLILDVGYQLLMELLFGIINAMPKLLEEIPQIISSIVNVLDKNGDKLMEEGGSLLSQLIDGLSRSIPQLISFLPEIINTIVTTLATNLPQIVDAGVQVLLALIGGLMDTLPSLIDYIPTIVTTIIDVITNNLPTIIEASVRIMTALIDGLIQALPQLIEANYRILMAFIDAIVENLPQIWEAGKKILKSLLDGINAMLDKLVELGMTLIIELGKALLNGLDSLLDTVSEMAAEVIVAFGKTFIEQSKKAYNWGKDLIQGLINGIKSMIHAVGDAVSDIADKIASFLHFSRPDVGALREYEEWMPDMLGGMSESLKRSTPQLMGQIKELANGINDAMTLEGTISATGVPNGDKNESNLDYMVEAFKKALSEMKVVMDDEEMGKFVDRTVTKLVYN